MTQNFKESELVGNIIAEGKGMMMTMEPKDIFNITQTIICGITDYLRVVKNKEKPTAVTISDLKGNLITAFVADYEEGEDGNPGNWNLYCTSNEEDIKDAVKYSINDTQIRPIINNRGLEDYNMTFSSTEFIPQLAIKLFGMIFDYLDQNAVEGETFELNYEGYFLATVDIKDGEKVKLIQPDGAIKRLIKDDKEASKEVA